MIDGGEGDASISALEHALGAGRGVERAGISGIDSQRAHTPAPAPVAKNWYNSVQSGTRVSAFPDFIAGRDVERTGIGWSGRRESDGREIRRK